MTEDEYYALLGKTYQAASDITYKANKLQTQAKELGVIYGSGYSGSFEEDNYDVAINNQLKYLRLLASSIEENAARLRRVVDNHLTNAGGEDE